MSTWQPIETAPKDGTVVLVFAPDASEPRVFTAQFNDYGEGGADWFDACDCASLPILATPTHWMPLPEPPAA